MHLLTKTHSLVVFYRIHPIYVVSMTKAEVGRISIDGICKGDARGSMPSDMNITCRISRDKYNPVSVDQPYLRVLAAYSNE